MRAYSKEKKVGFSFKVCLRWQRNLEFCSRGGVDWGWSCSPGCAYVQYLPSPSSWSQQHSFHYGFPFGRICMIRTQTLLSCFHLWSRVQWESEYPQLPMNIMAKHRWTCLGKRMNFFQWQHLLISSAQHLNNHPQTSHKTAAGISWFDACGETHWERWDCPWSAGTWVRCNQVLRRICAGAQGRRGCDMGVIGRGETKQKLRTWQLALPVWTTSIFIAFENAIMSVISTDYTTFFIVCINRHGMMELQLM